MQGRGNGELAEVEDPEMASSRRWVRAACAVQIVLCVGLIAVALAQRGRGLALLALQPFFISAAVLGSYGATFDRPSAVFAHALGSAGLSVVFAIFILASTFLQDDAAKPDWWILIINMPMDLYLLFASFLSLRLSLAMRRVRRELMMLRERIRQEFEANDHAPFHNTAARCHSNHDEALERRMQAAARHAGAVEARWRPQTPGQSISKDFCCPISMSVMIDPVHKLSFLHPPVSHDWPILITILDDAPWCFTSHRPALQVIAADGHSYEREYIARWLTEHSTSPLTGRVMPNKELIPNHRLRQIIQSHGIADTQLLL